jgi:hypothetical protein
MLYKGFNKLEVERITTILDRHQVAYTVGVPEDLGDGKRIPRDSAVYQIDLADEELRKIPPADVTKLADMRIIGEMESPFTDEELQNLEKYVPKKNPKAAEHAKIQQWATILAVGSMVLLYLYKKMSL